MQENEELDNVESGPGSMPPRSRDLESEFVADYEDSHFFYTLATFRVERCLFRVPRFKIEQQSSVFRDMFLLAGPEGNDCSNSGDETPIDLQQVSSSVFRDLLKFLYPQNSPNKSTYFDFLCTCDWDKERLLAVLELANKWEFTSVKELLFKKLDRYVPLYEDSIDEVLAVHKYNIEPRFEQAYQRLMLRGTPLTFQEREKLGHKRASDISEIREKHLLRRLQNHNFNGYHIIYSQTNYGVTTSYSEHGLEYLLDDIRGALFYTVKTPVNRDADAHPDSRLKKKKKKKEYKAECTCTCHGISIADITGQET